MDDVVWAPSSTGFLLWCFSTSARTSHQGFGDGRCTVILSVSFSSYRICVVHKFQILSTLG